jgi:hypothetical protein
VGLHLPRSAGAGGSREVPLLERQESLSALCLAYRVGYRGRQEQLLGVRMLGRAGHLVAYTGEVVPDRTIRVWSDLDTRLLMADLNAKLTQHIPS